ncbi:GNAT family N-acetyltransferase [Haloarchaeobius sp. HRN-SO-5]|uniref:GNAT family N-acetyltransferase n=1 Tax=Haloarchaeobius sp. HRN-SO-5 TaxID=3446118 RepID=UPI003EB9D051
MEIRELTSDAERRAGVPILRQLWTDREPDAVFAWTGDDDYTLFGGYVDGELVAVAGVVVTTVLHHVRHAWLYDLVVDEDHRGEGHGTELVRFVEDWAADRDCERVALASPREKEATHRFYENRDYERWGYVIERDI